MSTTISLIQATTQSIIRSMLMVNRELQGVWQNLHPGEDPKHMPPEWKLVCFDAGPRTGKTFFAVDQLKTNPRAIMCMRNAALRDALLDDNPQLRVPKPAIVSSKTLMQLGGQWGLCILDNASYAFPTLQDRQHFLSVMSPRVQQFLFLG